ncbi:NUDIX hydrolase [Methylobacterium sp. Leaf399]|uniref:NUDIX hydrolase n=1 Tax=unclassified Methylobacterium TaxID=2615210 RepID=UPI0006F1EE33|nr:MULTISPECIES: NUDIX hydrolase [unclassified Methylobacterium]KQP50538.1 NUDIX hydrolase [Methylobacterium sp. Leaf108]KQT08562.1 NUDIX hydrolase [Methylobacterium sp. Leaf399]KQT81868.1 NUDIX hydrolase [Methylobacterium sp. Leaf466]
MDPISGADPATTEPPASATPERGGRPPAARPRNAATLILVDRKGRTPKVLMGRRHAGLAFMPGKFVFPGGRIETWDRHMPVAGALSARAEAALTAQVVRPPHHLGRSLALAAIRETYEETGLLLGTRDYGAPEDVPDGPWAAFRDNGVLPDLEAMHLVARAITPPGRPRRFDTRFFAIDRTAVAGETPGVVTPDSELVELVWVNLSQARKLDLPRITDVILGDLEAQVAGGFAPYLPIPFYFERRGQRQRVLL